MFRKPANSPGWIVSGSTFESETLLLRTHFVVVPTETLPSEAIIRADLWRIRDVCEEICSGEIIKSDRVGGARSGIEMRF